MYPKGKIAKKSVSKSSRAGLIFPVSRILKNFRKCMLKNRFSAGTPVFTAGVLEYLVSEILDLAGQATLSMKLKRIQPRQIMLAVANDLELHQLLKNVTFPHAGVKPMILSELLPKAKSVPMTNLPAKIKPKKVVAKVKKVAKVIAPKAKIVKQPIKSPKAKVKNTTKPKAGKVTVLSERIVGETGQVLTVVHGDICHVAADAVVHPTSGGLSLSGQVGSALSRAGGAQLREAVQQLSKKIHSLGNLQAASCPAFGINADHIIHCNGPSYGEGVAAMAKQVRAILDLAEREKFSKIALPCIGSGNAGWPKQPAAQTILQAIHQYLRSTPSMNLKQVIFVLYDQETLDIYIQELGKLQM